MFNIGFGQLLIVLMIGFLVVGPQDLPKVARWLGRTIRYMKGMWIELLKSIDLEEDGDIRSTVRSIKGEVDDVVQTVKSADPRASLNSVTQELNAVSQAVRDSGSSVSSEISALEEKIK